MYAGGLRQQLPSQQAVHGVLLVAEGQGLRLQRRGSGRGRHQMHPHATTAIQQPPRQQRPAPSAHMLNDGVRKVVGDGSALRLALQGCE